MSTNPEFIFITNINQVRWLEFNRGPVKAFNRQMVEETRAAIKAAVDDNSIRVIVLASAVLKYFSAGAYLNEFRGMISEAMSVWVSMCHDIANNVRD